MPRVFISYVTEDAWSAGRLARVLHVYEVDLWWDRVSLAPGQRWKDEIRRGISGGDFFIACFSENYYQRSKTYMNEELTLAIDELRQRPINRTWFIPVLLSNCQLPDRSIGGGETLRDLQAVALYDDWSDGIARILSVIKPEIEPVHRALEGLQNPSARRRIDAAERLRALGKLAGDAVEPLLKLVWDENDTVCAAAADALGEIGQASEQVILSLLQRSSGKNRQHGYHYGAGHAQDALVRLARLVPHEVIPTVMRAIAKPELRPSALEVVSLIGPDAAELAPALITLLRERTYPESAGGIVRALGAIGAAAGDAVPLLVERLREKDADGYGMESVILAALGGMGEAARPTVPEIEAWAFSGDPRIGAAAIEALARLRHNEAASFFVSLLGRDDHRGHLAICEALEALDDPVAVPALINMLKHPNVAVRQRAVETLAKYGDVRAAPALIDALESDEELKRRISDRTQVSVIAAALGRIADPRAIPALIRAVNDPQMPYAERTGAMRVLGRFRDPSALPALILALKDDRFRLNALNAIGSIGDPAAIPHVRAMLDPLTENDWYRGTIERVLNELGANDRGT
jgi:HEAT repeat protein